ncbi:MAG: hypothetical protein PHW60_02820 [Kiritimatiellae bacterium]|nr:hypothetical protein [Kiritimatiellia bacterium]
MKWKNSLHQVVEFSRAISGSARSWSPSVGTLVIICVLTVLWQNIFFISASKLDKSYCSGDIAGLFTQGRCLYFYYHLGLFPVFYSSPSVQLDSRAGAESVLRDHGSSLRMESSYAFRSGDLGKIWLFLPEAIIKGTSIGITIFWANFWFFTLGLVAMLIAAWYAKQFTMGVLLVAFLGSHPFQLYEVYSNLGYGSGQVVGLTISVTIWALALHLPLIFDRKVHAFYLWSLPVFTGIFFSTMREVRVEVMIGMAGVLVAYVFYADIHLKAKAALCLVCLFAFLLVSAGWGHYWEMKYWRAVSVVKAHGGIPYTGPRDSHHVFWHMIWMGLGDFGEAKGYAWGDCNAFRYAMPIMKRQGVLPKDYAYAGTETSNYFYDGVYPRYICEGPEYGRILREKIFADIRSAPIWYFNILLRRARRILTEITPVRLGLGAHWVDIPLSGWLLLPTVVVLIILRHWRNIKLIVFCLPLSALPLLMYSGGGQTFYSIYPQVLAAIYAAGVWVLLAWIYGTLRERLVSHFRKGPLMTGP